MRDGTTVSRGGLAAEAAAGGDTARAREDVSAATVGRSARPGWTDTDAEVLP